MELMDTWMELFKIKKSKVDRGTYYKAWRKMFPDEFPEEIPKQIDSQSERKDGFEEEEEGFF